MIIEHDFLLTNLEYFCPLQTLLYKVSLHVVYLYKHVYSFKLTVPSNSADMTSNTFVLLYALDSPTNISPLSSANFLASSVLTFLF